MPDQYKMRYGSMTHKELDGSTQGRVEAWLTGLQMVADRPVFGVGAGCFGTAHAAAYSHGLRKNWLESHSIYIQVITELGIVGAIAFFGFMVQFLKLNRRVARALAARGAAWRWESMLVLSMFVGFAVLIVSGFFGHSLYRRTWYLYAALGLAVWRMVQQSPGETESTA
jgi:O-antigen ligase